MLIGLWVLSFVWPSSVLSTPLEAEMVSQFIRLEMMGLWPHLLLARRLELITWPSAKVRLVRHEADRNTSTSRRLSEVQASKEPRRYPRTTIITLNHPDSKPRAGYPWRYTNVERQWYALIEVGLKSSSHINL